MSPTHPINMSSIGLKLMKIEQIKKHRFLIPVTVALFIDLRMFRIFLHPIGLFDTQVALKSDKHELL